MQHTQLRYGRSRGAQLVGDSRRPVRGNGIVPVRVPTDPQTLFRFDVENRTVNDTKTTLRDILIRAALCKISDSRRSVNVVLGHLSIYDTAPDLAEVGTNVDVISNGRERFHEIPFWQSVGPNVTPRPAGCLVKMGSAIGVAGEVPFLVVCCSKQ